jgi:type I restriction enzyme S subunit
MPTLGNWAMSDSLPAGWIETALEGHVRIHSGIAPSELELSVSGPIPYVKVEDLNNCEKYQIESREYVQSCRAVAPAQSLIFPKRGAAIFANKVRIAGRPMVLDTNLMAVEALGDIDPEFFFYAIAFAGLHRLADVSTIPQLNNKHVYPHRLARPPLAEQQRIAQVLATWDAAIAGAEQLAASASVHREALVAQILLAEAMAGRWPMRPISEIATRVQRREAGDGELPVLMISSASGFVRQDQMYSRYMAGKSVENYIALEEGEFAYNKGNSKRYEFGCVYPLKGLPRGLVPHVYVCFRLHPEHDASFFEHLFAADYLHDQLGALVNTGVRNNGLLNIRPADFMTCRVPVPPIDVQERIAAQLAIAEAWVRRHDEYASRLRDEKTALMADLLTGKRRVRLPVSPTTS